MQYTYEIIHLVPRAEFMQVKYSSEGKSDYFIGMNPTQFDQEHIENMIHRYAPTVVDFWERQSNHPETVSFSMEGFGEAEPPVIEDHVQAMTPPAIEPQPPYDPFTQRVELQMIEDPTVDTIGWNIIDLTQAEQEQFLVDWRNTFKCSMRQARLALIQKGLLDQVNTAIASFPEPDKSIIETEWEYASLVDRNSPVVSSLAAILGLTETELDDLFKLAITL